MGKKKGKALTWEELAKLRWGPAKDDPEPGIILDHPDPDHLQDALMMASDQDPEAIEERKAIMETE